MVSKRIYSYLMRLRLILPLFLLLLGTSVAPEARAVCPDPALRADVALSVTLARSAFSEMDARGFQEFASRAQVQYACLAEPLGPADAAHLHLLYALSAFLDQDDGRAVNALRSAYATGTFTFPEDLVPEGHPLWVQVEVARGLEPGPDRKLARPSSGHWRIDGVRTRALPADRPAFLQHVDDEGTVVRSMRWEPGEPLPSGVEPAGAGADTPAAAESTAGVNTEDLVRRRNLGLATGGAALLAGGLYALAWQRHGRVVDPETPQEDLSRLRTQNTVATWASAAAGVGAVGLGVVLVVRW